MMQQFYEGLLVLIGVSRIINFPSLKFPNKKVRIFNQTIGVFIIIIGILGLLGVYK